MMTYKDLHCLAVRSGMIDKMNRKNIHRLIGYYTPYFPAPGDHSYNPLSRIPIIGKYFRKMYWDVTLHEGGYLAETQFEAEVISSLAQIEEMLMDLHEEKRKPSKKKERMQALLQGERQGAKR